MNSENGGTPYTDVAETSGRKGEMLITRELTYQKTKTSHGSQVDVGNKDERETEDKAVANAYDKQIYIPLDFELLETHMPFYQSAFADRLEYELTFNDYRQPCDQGDRRC